MPPPLMLTLWRQVELMRVMLCKRTLESSLALLVYLELHHRLVLLLHRIVSRPLGLAMRASAPSRLTNRLTNRLSSTCLTGTN